MYWLYYILLLPFMVMCIVLAVFNLPGLWLLAAGVAMYDWATGWDQLVSAHVVIAMLIMAGAAEAIDFFAASAGAKRAGASGRGMAGAIVGGIAGGLLLSIPLPAIGTVLGICLGAFVGAALVELLRGRSLGKSLHIGAGAAKGRFLGIVVKVFIGTAMLVTAMVAGFP